MPNKIKKFIKSALISLGIMCIPVFASASILGVQQGGTGGNTFTIGQCIVGNGINPFTSSPCSSGGGGGGGTWATTTSSVPGELINYSLNNTDIVSIGGTSTTTAKFWFDPNVLLAKILGSLWVTASSTFSNFTAVNSTSTQATTTAFAITNISSQLLKTSAGGSVIPAISGTDYQPAGSYVLNIGPTGQLQSNSTITTASSSTGTDFSITGAANTLTWNLPTSSATNRGLLSSADWTTFNNKGSGTVTAVSVATANGLAGSSSGGATPALTLSTTVNSNVLKGNGTAISGAVNGTDYTLLSTTNCSSGFAVTNLTASGGVTCGAAFSTTSADAYINASSTIAHPGGGSAGNLMEWNGSGWVSIATTSSAIGLQPRIGLTTTGSSGAATFDGTTLNIPQYTGGSSAYPFSVTTPTTGNATSTLTQFNGGLTAFASSTIGSGSGTGLTVSGNQVVTGTILAGGNITTSQNVSGVAQVVISNSGNGITGGSGFRVTNNLAHGGNFQVNSSAFINNGTLKPDQTVISNDTGTGGINITNINGSQDISIGINKNFSSLFISSTTNNVGIGTTSPYAQLSVVGQVAAQYFTATSTTVASTFPYASTTNISADTICLNGDTCRTTWPTGGGGAYPFNVAVNSTSTLVGFNGGLTSYASTTIGNGTGTGGLTISGNSTTTGNAYFKNKVFVGTTTDNGNGYNVSIVGANGGAAYLNFFAPNGSPLIQLQNGPDDLVGTGNVWNEYMPMGSTDLRFFNLGDRFTMAANGNFGVATTVPSSLLSVGNTNGINFRTATSSFSSTGGIDIASGCYAIKGTCLSTGGVSGAAYPFQVTTPSPGNATSTLTQFNGGLTSFASSTIGAGGQATGLTISGGATTTGTQIVQGTGTSTYTGGINVDTQGNGCGFADNGVCIQTYIQNATAYKSAANYATVSALPANTYNNGTSGVGATLTEVGTGALSVDGASPSIGQRILVKNEATQANNGVYTVTVTGSGIAAYILTRSSDFNTSNDVYAGVTVPVLSGTANGGSAWVQTTTGVITIGTTAIVFSESSFGTGVLPWASGGTNNSVSYASSTIPISDGTKLYPIATSSLGLQQALTLTTTGSSGASTLSANGVLNIPQYTGGGGSSQVVGGFTQPATSTSVTLNLATTVTATSTTIQLNMASSNYTIFPINATSSLGAWWYLDLTAPMSGSIGSTTISYCNWNGQIAPGTSVVNGLTDEYKLSVTASTTAAGVFTPFLKCDYVGSY